MSTLDREPRLSRGPNDALHERRVDPGVPGRPMRVNQPSTAPKVPPRGKDMTGIKLGSVKR
jgi:hypothetical protein